ncbi:putative 54S ribosomal protein L7, mitochondrial [Schizosaccharomyces pombe]
MLGIRKNIRISVNFLQRRTITVKQKLGKNRPLPGWDPNSEYFRPGPTMLNRLQEHLHDTILPDVLAASYRHDIDTALSTDEHTQKDRLPRWIGDNPYYKNRPPQKMRGNKPLLPVKESVNPKNLPSISKVVVSTMHKEALVDKTQLLSTMMAFRSITGLQPEIVYARKDVSPWKLRSGVPVGVKVTLTGESMYTFLSILSELVLPQLHNFKGLSPTSGDQTGNISFGLPSEVMPLFPQIEAVYEMYPHSLPGFNVNITTNSKDTRLARFFVSSLIPFTDGNKEGYVG